jgi:two-component system chemotaxis response regulator CheY
MIYNILIIDDSATMRAIIKKIVTMSNMKVGSFFEAENGKTGLDVLKNNLDKVNLLLMDINMPVMNGIEMLKTIKEDENLAAIDKIIISTDGTSQRVEEAKSLGARFFIRKPFDAKEIKQVLDKMVE